MPYSAFNPPPLAGEVPEGRREHSFFGHVLIPQLKKHTVQHAFQIVIHVVIPDPVNMPPLRLQEGSSPHIMSDLVVFRMSVSIHFHQQPCINACEIRDERPDRNLTPKPIPCQLTPTQVLSQNNFCSCHGSAQSARLLDGELFVVPHFPLRPVGHLPRERGRISCRAYRFILPRLRGRWAAPAGRRGTRPKSPQGRPCSCAGLPGR